MLRFTPNDDTYSMYKNEFWFELAIIMACNDLNETLKNKCSTIPPAWLNEAYAALASCRESMNAELSPENRLKDISELQETVTQQQLDGCGLDTYEHLLDFLNMNKFSENPLSLYLYLSHPSTPIPPSFELYDLMNKSIGHCHAVISVDKVIDSVLNQRPCYFHEQVPGSGVYVPGIISIDLTTILSNINLDTYRHLLRVDKTRNKLMEIYQHSPEEVTLYHGEEKGALIQAAFGPQSEVSADCR